MNFSIKTKNLKLNDKIRVYVKEKIEKNLDKLLINEKSPLGAEFELSRTTWHHKKGRVFEAEINLVLHGHSLILRSGGQTIEQAIDELKDEMEREIKKHKGKELTVSRKRDRLFKRLLKFSPLSYLKKK